jgi:hypothetical protein
MLVALIAETVSADPPNETVAPLWKPVPLIVTDVPPAAGPAFALTELTVGAATYVKQPVHVPLCVSAFVTTTFTAPAPCEVVVPVMVVAVIPEIVTAAPPNDEPQPPGDAVPSVDLPGVCVSLPDHRYEVRLPDGQVIVVTTHRRAGCPDLASILKQLQEAAANSD